jgi:hypothetical protein
MMCPILCQVPKRALERPHQPKLPTGGGGATHDEYNEYHKNVLVAPFSRRRAPASSSWANSSSSSSSSSSSLLSLKEIHGLGRNATSKPMAGSPHCVRILKWIPSMSCIAANRYSQHGQQTIAFNAACCHQRRRQRSPPRRTTTVVVKQDACRASTVGEGRTVAAAHSRARVRVGGRKVRTSTVWYG